jgi:hypothetical protein
MACEISKSDVFMKYGLVKISKNRIFWPLTPCASKIPKSFKLEYELTIEVFHLKHVWAWDLNGAACYEALKIARGQVRFKGAENSGFFPGQLYMCITGVNMCQYNLL